MRLNRNHYLIAGIVILLLGLQFRLVNAFVLNEDATRFLASRTNQSESAPVNSFNQWFATAGPMPKKSIQPPDWMGWMMLSAGSVLFLHSLAMKKPDAPV